MNLLQPRKEMEEVEAKKKTKEEDADEEKTRKIKKTGPLQRFQAYRHSLLIQYIHLLPPCKEEEDEEGKKEKGRRRRRV